MQSQLPHAIQLHTVIYIGASSVSMLLTSADGTEEIDFLEQSIPIAHDIFSKQRVTKSSIEKAVIIIRGYLDNIIEYGPQKPEDIKIVTTNILYEANNKENFITRLEIACGLPVSILDDGEMTRLLYLKTRRRLKDTPAMQQRTTLVIHVGPGNTRTILFNQGRIVSYSSYRLGTHRTAEAIDTLDLEGDNLIRVIREHAGGQISAIVHQYKDAGVQEIVLIGYEIQNLSSHLLKKGTNHIPLHSLRHLTQTLANLSIDKIVKNYPLDYRSAEAAVPALEINIAIIEELNVKSVSLPGSDYERGLLTDLSSNKTYAHGFEHEVLQSAFQLSEKFQVHPNHAKQVCALCVTLFERLLDFHQLNKHDLLLLKAAAILHEAGGFINPKAHHKHSMYLIMNSEIFGLGQDDVNLIALIARYHRNSPPKPTHAVYKDLLPKDQIRVTKLASILRVADALDRSHLGRVGDIDVTIKKRKMHLTLHGTQDASVERIAMRSKGDLMQDIFGMEIYINESIN